MTQPCNVSEHLVLLETFWVIWEFEFDSNLEAPNKLFKHYFIFKGLHDILIIDLYYVSYIGEF